MSTTEFMISRQIGLLPKGRFPTRLAAVIIFVGLYGEAIMGTVTYFQQFTDSRWKRKMEEVLKDSFGCEVCGDDEKELSVHVKQYLNDRAPWDYDTSQLAVVCEDCRPGLSVDYLMEVTSCLPLEGPNERDLVANLIAGFIGLDCSARNRNHAVAYHIGRSLSEQYFDLLKKVLLEPESSLAKEVMSLIEVTGEA